MKALLMSAIMMALGSGCATSSNWRMQPDGSYQIVANRTTIFTSGIQDESRRRAEELCPMGYVTQSEFDNGSKERIMIVKCKHPDATLNLPDKISNIQDPKVRERVAHPMDYVDYNQ